MYKRQVIAFFTDYITKNVDRLKSKQKKTFLKNLEQVSTVSKYYKSLSTPEIPISVFKKDNNEETTPGIDTIKHLYETHFPSHTEKKHTQYDNTKTVRKDELWNIHKDTVSLEKVKRALKGFNSKKSPGPDNFKPIMFKHFPTDIYKHIMLIYRACFYLEYTPTPWKDTKVIFIPKPGKEDYNLAKSFRPISLSNYLLKGLERLLGWHINEMLIQFPIHTHQHGFCSEKSTESAISKTVDYIESKIMTSNRHCVGLSLDIQAAFDSITPNTIKAALLKHGGDPQLVQWYYNYLIHRNLITTIQNDTFTASNAIGFPQGGVVSADFWKIAFNPALEIINSNLTTGFGYADDLMILRHGYKPEASVNAIQTILNRLINWGETCNLKFNPTKTLMMIFSSKKTTPKSTIPLKINDQDVTTVNSIRYLGVTLDSKLSWDQHRNITIQNA